jgi:hypothetical protein
MHMLLQIVPRKYHYYIGYIVGKLQSFQGRK